MVLRTVVSKSVKSIGLEALAKRFMATGCVYAKKQSRIVLRGLPISSTIVWPGFSAGAIFARARAWVR
jgi:hypothetical protein